MKKRIWFILINVVLIAGLYTFILLHNREERQKSLSNQITAFGNMTVAMEQVTANYMETEQGICDTWARYINSAGMTIDEAAGFLLASQKPGIMGQIVFADTRTGLSTVAKSTDPEDFTVSYERLDVLRDVDTLDGPGEGNKITRSYTNPVNGTQSIAFYNPVLLKDREDGSDRKAWLLRILPLSVFEKKWTFPTKDYEKAEISLIDLEGNYIIKGRSFKNNNFFEFYKSYNPADYASLEALRQEIGSNTGTMTILNSKSEQALLAYTPVRDSEGWAIISYIPMAEIGQQKADWMLIGVVFAGLMSLLIFDMSMLSGLNRSLAAAAREADSANRAKTEFLSTMSHDIRTPMNAIIGLTTITEKNTNDPELVGENLRKISLASSHLLTLINDILDISKVESGKLSLSPVSFSIAESAENLVNMSQPLVKEKNIDFRFRTGQITYEYLFADQLRLNQILINILSNAIKYTPPQGSVYVDLNEDPGSRPGTVLLTYRVEDTGIGMTPEFMEKMYQPFSRQTDSRVNTIQGTGLGLAITKQMVDLMGGTIDCKSKPNEGTCFTIKLEIPIAERQPEEMALDPIDILLVDDDQVFLDTADDALKSLGALAETSTSGREALRMIAQRHEIGKDYSIAIIDWKMPEIDGLELTRQIRALVGNDLPILLISAYDCSEIEEAAKQAGANGFISKPLFRSTLYKKITDILGMENQAGDFEEDNSDIAGMSILIAEDNDVNWEIISMLLDMYGIRTERAVNGKIAVEMAAENAADYDLIFMDIQMPVMNGLDAARAIRKLEDPRAASLPIIAMTADAFSENVAECLEAGMDGHIAKPIDIKLVLKEIRRIKEASK